jgi:hypothetical protein
MRTPLLALAALLLLPGCPDPLLYAEVEVPRAVVTVKDQAFTPTGSGGVACAADPSITRLAPCTQEIVDQDLGKDYQDLSKNAVSQELRLTSLTIAVPASDLTFPGFGLVARARVMALSAPPAAPPAVQEVGIELARYERGATDPGRSVDIPMRSGLNLADFVTAGHLYLRTELEIDSPGLPAFLADITDGFYIKVRVDWGKEAGLL